MTEAYDQESIRVLLLESYQLDPGAIEYLVEETLLVGEDEPIRLVCSTLNQGPLTDVQRRNLGDFVERAIRQPSVARRFARALRKFGRCPKAEKSWLRRHLGEKRRLPTDASTELHARASIEGLVLDDGNWSLDRLPQLLDRIGLVRMDADQFEIKLGSFTYASTLAILAGWLLRENAVNRFVITCPPEMRAYLERIRFHAALRNPEIYVSPDFMDWAVGLTRINEGLPTEDVTKKIVDIIDTFINPEAEARQAFEVLIAEMIENVHRHAESLVDGFAVAQVYPRRLKMGITFVDGGIGVRRSFETGDPSLKIDHLDTDGAFLREACKLHVTSKASRHSGYGLYLLSEVVARNRGTFSITSGGATLAAYLRNGEVYFEEYKHYPWRGTIVSVIVDLEQKLPILDVYKRMPAPEGYENDDLFN